MYMTQKKHRPSPRDRELHAMIDQMELVTQGLRVQMAQILQSIDECLPDRIPAQRSGKGRAKPRPARDEPAGPSRVG
jgi:hypothetical protein